MVPVIDSNNIPLMPCSEKRARQMMEKNQAKPWYQKGFFGIKLLKEPSARNYQDVAGGIDTGSKREAYGFLTKNAVIANVLTDTPDWVKERVETRKMLRRVRRQRKTPYRACRWNRATLWKENRIPPSTKAFWDAKLRIIKVWMRLIPLTIINVEDIKAKALPNTSAKNKKHNQSFSPLEVGKNYFYNEIRKMGLKLIITQGYETAEYRKQRGFNKLPKGKKLVDSWEAHNVDAHCLAEMALGIGVKSFKQFYRLNFYQFRKRHLHVENPKEKGFRQRDGGTVSMGLARGSVVRWKNQLCYIGGSSKGMIAVHDLKTKIRLNQFIKINKVKMLYRTSWRVHFIKNA